VPLETPTVVEAARNPALALVLGLVSGVAGVAFVVSLFLGGWGVATPPTETLGDFQGSTGSGGFHPYWILPVVTVLIFAILLVPRFSLLGEELGRGRPVLARTAAYLSATGAVLVALGFLLSYAVLASLASVPAPPGTSPAYAAAIWASGLASLEGFGLILLAVGLLIFGGLAWNSHVLPRWLAIVGFVGGVAGLFGFVPTWGTDISLVVPVVLIVWCLAVAGILGRTTRGAGSPQTAG
jgi:Domain of unknown function (DUF4386)